MNVLNLHRVGRLHHLEFLNLLVEDLELFFASNQGSRFGVKLSLADYQLRANLASDFLRLDNHFVLVLSLVDGLLLIKNLDPSLEF